MEGEKKGTERTKRYGELKVWEEGMHPITWNGGLVKSAVQVADCIYDLAEKLDRERKEVNTLTAKQRLQIDKEISIDKRLSGNCEKTGVEKTKVNESIEWAARRCRDLDQDDLDQIAHLYVGGMSCKAISHVMDIYETRLNQIVKDLKLNTNENRLRRRNINLGKKLGIRALWDEYENSAIIATVLEMNHKTVLNILIDMKIITREEDGEW